MKVIMIGPTKGGKSSIADFVAEMSPSLGREAYDPTIGVRYVFAQPSSFFQAIAWSTPPIRHQLALHYA
jgi:hypothetical protein